jgi:hypothetical protein
VNPTGYVLAVMASILWGLTYCLDERVLSSLSIYKLYFLHCICGAAVAGAILVFQRQSLAGLFMFDASVTSVPLVGLTLVTATAAALSILANRPSSRSPTPCSWLCFPCSYSRDNSSLP